ncbi:MAG: FtsK/SpoIIIE domain-containing protein [Spirochaetia bacterium]
MKDAPRNRIKFATFFSMMLVAVLLILNIAYSSIEQLPPLPNMQELKDALVYAAYFISALMQGAQLSSQYLLTGILLVVIFPAIVLALLFRKSILQIIISITIYSALLFAVSAVLPLLGIHPAPNGEQRIITMIIVLLNYPFGFIFYICYLLIGAALYPLPAFLAAGSVVRRYWGGKRAYHVFRSIVWGYLEVIIFTAMLSLFSQAVYGGILIQALGSYISALGGGVFLAVVFGVTFFEYLLFVFRIKHKHLLIPFKALFKSKPKIKQPRASKPGKKIEDAQEKKPSVSMDFSLVSKPDKEIDDVIEEEEPLEEAEGEAAEETDGEESPEEADDDEQSGDEGVRLEEIDDPAAKNAKYHIDEVCSVLSLPVTYEQMIIGPSFYLFVYSVDQEGTLKEVKKQEDELWFRLKEHGTRPLIPVPGMARVGFLCERSEKDTVFFSDAESKLTARPEALPIYLGKTLTGEELFTDLAAHPHLLVAGSTGSGKSIFLHAMIQSFLYSPNRQAFRMVLIDPKRVEFSVYDKSRHLACPVLEDLPEIEAALTTLVNEMEGRYQFLEKQGFRDIASYNTEQEKKLAYVAVIIDEAADILLQDKGEIKRKVILLAQKARAVGIHVVLATQRPSADVIDGLIKANFPARIAFRTASASDSRIILGEKGAEDLIGRGDCLFKDAGETVRLQGAFWQEKE